MKKSNVVKKSKPVSTVEEFKELYWLDRKELSVDYQARLAKGGEAHKKALEYAKSQNMPWAVKTLEASALSFQKSDGEEALRILSDVEVPLQFQGDLLHLKGSISSSVGDSSQAIDYYTMALEMPGYERPGNTLYNLGILYFEQRNYNEAINFYQRAIDAPKFDMQGGALNNLGLAYARLGQADEAFSCFNKALTMPGYENHGNAYFNLGSMYFDRREYEKAIDFYRKTLNDVFYDKPGDCLNNLGLAYFMIGDFERAIESYKSALEVVGYDTPQLTRNNIANALQSSGKLEEARKEIEIVLSLDDSEEQHARSKYILSLIDQQLRRIEPTPGEKALANPPPKDKYAALMQGILQDKPTQYDKYIEDYTSRSIKRDSNEFAILRGWSSSVTLLEGASNRKWPGGGYFLRWREKGLVIDPGFDFLDNFHESGFHVLDIHAVAVSHDHPDHNGDLRSLDDLCYETHRSAKNPRPDNEKKTLFMLDADSYRRIPNATADHRGTLCMFNMRATEDKVWFGGIRNRLPFQIEHFPVIHSTDVPAAQGFKVVLLNEDGSTNLTIGYTGDTKYHPELTGYLTGIDILVAHVSQPSPKELIDESHFKDDHLGYNGLMELVRAVKPRLTLVGEFWAGLADLRLEIVGGVRHRSGLNSILPACLGLRVNLDDLSIQCTKCKVGCPVDKVKVAPPTAPFGDLGYLCPECVL